MGTTPTRTLVGRSLATRLLGALTAAGVAIVAFAAYIYLQVVAPIDDPAVRSTVTSGFVGLVLASTISLILVAVTFGSNTAITLQLLSGKAREIEDGEMDVNLQTSREDELGDLARSLSGMRDALRARIETAERRQRETRELNERLQGKAEHYNEVLRGVMEGDLSRRVDPESENEALAEIGEAINLTIGELQRTTRSLSRELDNLSATAEEVAASAGELVETSTRAAEAGSVGREAATSAIEEMNAVEAETKSAVEEIEALEAEMAEIVDVARVIGEIARKTNILAVNARIESSRVEDGGQGYSVVADEVRELAEETREAAEDVERRVERLGAQTDETAADIRAASDRTSETAVTVRKALDSLEAIAELVDDVDMTVENISDATDEQAEAVQTVASRVESLSSIGGETESETGGEGAEREGEAFEFGAGAQAAGNAEGW